jgi:outer membrane protein assembly factor BamB
MKRVRLGWATGAIVLALLGGHADEVNWPQFRGPRGDGTSLSTGLPLGWQGEEKVRWQTPVHGRAWSSPVIWDGQIWLTTATEDGRELGVVCLDAAAGKVLHDRRLFEVERPQFAHKFNTYASPTPVVESGRVYVTFGSPGIACLDSASGAVLWDRRDFECNHFRGAGSSPIVYEGLILVNYDGSDHQYVVAIDKSTGRTVWRRERSIDYRDLGPDGKPDLEGDYRKAYGTCHVAVLGGRTTLLSHGSKALYGYNPVNGDELWRVEERSSYSASTRPVVGLGLVFAPTGWSSGQLIAVRPGEKGEVIDANAETNRSNAASGRLAVVWKTKRSVPKKPSLLLLGDLLFGLDDSGVASCWEALTGRNVWNERVGGNYSASPLAADGRIYCFSEEGKVTVLAAGREFKKLAESKLGDGFMASPAVTGKALILRSRTSVYRIE